MNKYLMTFKPVDTFFFGQENKYRKKKNEHKFTADYYQVSAFFPQQTSVLGMLRYFVLLQNDQIPINNKDTANDLIGKSSFNVTIDTLDFGKIKSLSPVFLRLKERNYIPNPFDFVLKNNEKDTSITPLIYEEKELKSNHATQVDNTIFFLDYKEKDGLSNFLINTEDTNDYLVYNKEDDKEKYVFEKVEKVGINKNETENALYKQVLYKFRNNSLSFACFIEMEIDLDESQIYQGFLGAEKSIFNIKFEQIMENDDFDFLKILNLEKFNTPKVVLLSDAFLEKDESNYLFSINKTKPFRFLTSEITVNGTYGKFNESGGILRSSRFNLFERGSVFYFKDIESLKSFTTKLQSGVKEKNFYKIGYNYFQTIEQ